MATHDETRGTKESPDAQLVTELFDEYGDALYNYAFRFLNDSGRAADLVQEVMLKAWRNPQNIHPRTGNPRGWLFTVARNLLTDWHRRSQQRPELSVEHDSLPEATHPGDELERMLESWQMAEALGRLTPAHRAVLQQVYFRGRSTAEAADSLGIPVGTVKSRTYHALQHLRTILIEMGVQS